MPKVKPISQADYARHRGCSQAAVNKAIKQGRITTQADGSIDAVAADAQWAQNSRPRARARSDIPMVPVRDELPDAPSEDYWASRARREAAEATIAEMRRDELEGQLIRADAIRASLARRVSAMRDALLQIPARLAPVLAAETTTERVVELLELELRQALADLSSQNEEAIDAGT